MRPADRSELARFVSALFCRADLNSFVSMRAFYDQKDGFALYDAWQTIRVTGNDEDIVDAAEDLATLAALDDEAIVFAPPVATFINRDKADEASLANGLVISAELDVNPMAGRQQLEAVLGPATLVMESGGLWIDAATGELIPKLHLHWRLATPTRIRPEHDLLKEANKLATILAGGDPSGVPLVHPLRWAGSWHRKAEPRLARIVDYLPDIEVTLAVALTKLRAASAAVIDPPPPKGDGFDYPAAQPDFLDLCAALAVIPNDDRDPGSWDQWNDMGLRIFAATGGDEVGLALFLNWSQRSKKFDDAKTRARWKRYAKSPPDRTNAGAIFNLARKAWPNFVRPSQYARLADQDASLKEFDGRVGREPRQCPLAVGREAAFVRKAEWPKDLLLTTKGGIRTCLANAITALRTAPEWEDRIWFDAFHNRVVLRGIPPWSRKKFDDEPWSDLFDNLLTDWMQHCGLMVSRDIAGQAVWTVAHDLWFHPVRQLLIRCRDRWDGERRTFNWPTTYLGAPFNDYSEAVGQRWLISLVARVMEPGCKADSSLVLEGPQGTFKSEVFRILGYPWVTDDIGGSPLGSKDAAIQTAGIWIFELAELDEHTLGRDVAKTKSFMSRSTDRYRPPYGTHSLPQPRQCGFGCTTNKSEYLPDETGNRRWWPIPCNRIKLDRLQADREQLLGEAVSLYEQGQPWWLDTIALTTAAAAEQDTRYVPDSWDAPISEYLDHPTEIRSGENGHYTTVELPPRSSVTVPEILKKVLHLDIGDWSQRHENRVAKSLRQIGWVRKQIREKGDREWRYYRPKNDQSPVEW